VTRDLGRRPSLANEAEATTRARLALADRFALISELGRGAATTVFRARDPSSGSTVILQLVHPDHGYDVGSERFVREIGHLALLQSPRVLAGPDEDGHPPVLYYLRPDEADESLGARIRREGALPLERALSFALDLALALGDLAGRGWVHGAIAPETIRLIGGRAFLTGVGGGFAVGQAMDRAAADMKDLGALLLIMLTGDEHGGAPSLSKVPAPVQSLVSRIISDTPTPSAELVAEWLNEMLASIVRASRGSGNVTGNAG